MQTNTKRGLGRAGGASVVALGVAAIMTIGAGSAIAASDKDFVLKQNSVPEVDAGQTAKISILRTKVTSERPTVRTKLIAPEHTTWAKDGYQINDGDVPCQRQDGNRVMVCEARRPSEGATSATLTAEVIVDANAPVGTELKKGSATVFDERSEAARSNTVPLSVKVKKPELSGKEFTGEQQTVPKLNPGETGEVSFLRTKTHAGEANITTKFVAPENTTWAKAAYTWRKPGSVLFNTVECKISADNRELDCGKEHFNQDGDRENVVSASLKVADGAKPGTVLKGGSATITAKGVSGDPIPLAVEVKKSEDIPMANPKIAAAAGAVALAGGAFVLNRRRNSQAGR